MPLLNHFLRAFFRSHFVSQCSPVQDHILLVPVTEILTNTRDRESGTLYSELAGQEEFLGSHVLRVPSEANTSLFSSREGRGKARQYTTINGRMVVIKDSWVYANKGFRSLNHAQLLHDICYYPDAVEPQQWLIYYISKPLIGSLEHIPLVPAQIQPRMSKEDGPKHSEVSAVSLASPTTVPPIDPRKKSIGSFNELLILFPLIAGQIQGGLEDIYVKFGRSFEKPLPPSPPSSAVPSISSRSSSVAGDENTGVSFASEGPGSHDYRRMKSVTDEHSIRKALESAVVSAVELFQKVDQSQLNLVASTTDLTEPVVEKLIERHIAEQLHGTLLFPRVCATKREEDEELDRKIKTMENVDLTQVGIPYPYLERNSKSGLVKRLNKAIDSFKKMSSANSPHAMIDILLETAQSITRVDEPVVQSREGETASSEKESSHQSNTIVLTVNADTLVSLLLMVVIRSKVSHLNACLSYMRNYIFGDNVEQGEKGYILSTLEAVIYHIVQDNDQLSLASSKNRELWRCIKRGSVEGLRKILEPSDIEEPGEGPGDASSGDSGSYIGYSQEVSNKGFLDPDSSDEEDESETSLQSAWVPEVLHNRIEAPGKVEDKPEIPLARRDSEWTVTREITPPFSHPTSPDHIANSALTIHTDVQEDGDSIHSSPEYTVVSSSNTSKGKKGEFYTPGIVNGQTETLASTSMVSLAITVKDTLSLSQLSRTHTVTSHKSSTSQAADISSVEKLSKTRNAYGDSVIMIAIQERQPKIIRYLLNCRHFPTAYVLDDDNNDGTTLLCAAIQLQNTEVIEVLLDIVLKLPDDTIKQYLQRTDIAGRAVGHYLFHTPDLIERLGSWVSWRQRDRNGQTPLFALCRSYDHSKYREMVKLAIRVTQESQQDVSPLHLDEHVDNKGNTLLHIVGDPVILRVLLKCDAEVNAVNDKGFTPLMVASKYGRVDSVRTFFGDQRVDISAKEIRGLTAVELAKDDDVRNRIDDLVLFTNPPNPDGRVTAIVRSFFVEDATIRFVIKSGAPSGQQTLTITTCRRSLQDFEFLTQWLAYENPASWLPALPSPRSPFQIPSKPSRAILRDIQLRLDSFLRTLLSHSTFSTHELLWEFFLVPELHTDQLIDRCKRKAELRIENIRDEYNPVEDIKEVEVFVAHAKDAVRSITYAFRSITRRASLIRFAVLDFSDAYKMGVKAISSLTFLAESGHIATLNKFSEAIAPNESHPHIRFIEDLRDIQASLTGVMTALERPKHIISDIASLQKQVDRHMVSLRRSDRWPLGILDETRSRIHEEAAENVRKAKEDYHNKACELRWTHSVAASELAAFHELREKTVKRAVRNLAYKSILAEKARLEAMRRAIRAVLPEGRPRAAPPWARGSIGRTRLAPVQNLEDLEDT